MSRRCTHLDGRPSTQASSPDVTTSCVISSALHYIVYHYDTLVSICNIEKFSKFFLTIVPRGTSSQYATVDGVSQIGTVCPKWCAMGRRRSIISGAGPRGGDAPPPAAHCTPRDCRRPTPSVTKMKRPFHNDTLYHYATVGARRQKAPEITQDVDIARRPTGRRPTGRRPEVAMARSDGRRARARNPRNPSTTDSGRRTLMP